jgi:hypothetical protein
MECDSSREQDYFVEIAANPQAMAAAMGQTASTVAQKAVQDSLMSGTSTMPQEQLSDSCAVHDRRKFAPGGLVGTEISFSRERLRTSRWNVDSTQPISRRVRGACWNRDCLVWRTPPDIEGECRQYSTRQQTWKRRSCVSVWPF